NFVYPAREALVPHWLNEGLAQIFETAILEADSLRVGHVDKVRQLRLRALVKDADLVGVDRLLKAGPKEFLVGHASRQELANRYYLTSWALAFYLMTDRKLLNDRKKLDEYVTTLKKNGTSSVAAFEKLVGKPLPQFQTEFRSFVDKLVELPKK